MQTEAEILKTLIDAYDSVMTNTHYRLICNPIKTINTTREENGIAIAQASELFSMYHGEAFKKSIFIDDETGVVDESLSYYKPYYKPVVMLGTHITVLRCALMNCLMFRKIYPCYTGNEVVGFLGNGRINLETARCLHQLMGVSNFIIRGSMKDRSKNIDKFANYGRVNADDGELPSLLNTCNVLFVCTSSLCEDMVSEDMLPDVDRIVCLDCGYVLDESFRNKWESYTDHKEQIEHYYGEEFPLDEHEHEMMQVGREFNPHGKAVIYMHGIGLADFIVAKGTVL